MSGYDEIVALIEQKKRRLHHLKLQEARKGYSTPPETLIEIEDIEKEIRQLEREAVDLASAPSLPPAGPTADVERIAVRVFCIHTQFCSNELKKLFLRQNRRQLFFDIGIASSWQFWPQRTRSEAILGALQTTSRLEFCEKFQEEMNRYNKEYDPFLPDGINLAVTELSFPRNYFTWNTRDRKGIVIGIRSLQSLFHSDPMMVRSIVLRVTQRMLLYSLFIPGLQFHEDTRGCLFDLARALSDIQFSVDDPRLCKPCQAALIAHKGQEFGDSVNDWLQKSLL